MTYLVTRQPCVVCRGSGKMLHRQWAGFFDAWRKSGGGSPAEQVDSQRAYFVAMGFSVPPDLMVTCSCCDGEGRMRGRIHADDVAFLPAETASGFGLPPVVGNKPGMAAVIVEPAEQGDQDVCETSHRFTTPVGASC